MVLVTGQGKVVTVGAMTWASDAGLEVILRPSGRFIIREVDAFIALSEKKTKSITISGNIPAGGDVRYNEHETTPTAVEFEVADLFPQEILNEFVGLDEQNCYGLMMLMDLAISTDPADGDDSELSAVQVKVWISKQPMTSWAEEDSVQVVFTCYDNNPMANPTGVMMGTIEKRRIPLFVPIKTWTPLRKQDEKLYVYTKVNVVGMAGVSVAGGAIAGSASLEIRVIEGIGYLSEEVEELLSTGQ